MRLPALPSLGLRAALFLPLLAALPPAGALAQEQELTRIVAVVNDDAVSAHDLAARFRFVAASTGAPQSAEEQDELLDEVLDTLIDEQLMRQAARNLSIRVTPQELDSSFARFASLYGHEPDSFLAALEEGNIPALTIWNKIDAEIRWAKIVESRVVITTEDVEAEIASIRSAEGTPEYLVRRIFLAVLDEAQRGQAQRHAAQLRESVAEGESFPALALAHSHSLPDFQNGEWIRANALEEPVAAALGGMATGEVSAPLDTSGGVYLIELLDQRTVTLPEDEAGLRSVAENQLFQRVSDSINRGLLNQLRANALIDRRI